MPSGPLWTVERTKVDGVRVEFRLTNRTGFDIRSLSVRCDGCEFVGQMGDPLPVTDEVAVFSVYWPDVEDTGNLPRLRIAWDLGEDRSGSWESYLP